MAKKKNIPKAHRNPPKPKAEKKKRKRSRFVDLEQIRRWFTTNHYDAETPETFVVSEVFSCYAHPKGKHKPLASSIKQAIRREWKRWEKPTPKERRQKQYNPYDNPDITHHMHPSDRITMMRVEYPQGKHVYDDFQKQKNPHNALGNVDALTRKIQRDLVKNSKEIERLKGELIEAENQKKILDDKVRVLDDFLQSGKTLEVISLIEKDLQ